MWCVRRTTSQDHFRTNHYDSQTACRCIFSINNVVEPPNLFHFDTFDCAMDRMMIEVINKIDNVIPNRIMYTGVG